MWKLVLVFQRKAALLIFFARVPVRCLLQKLHCTFGSTLNGTKFHMRLQLIAPIRYYQQHQHLVIWSFKAQNSKPIFIIHISISICILNMNSALSNWTFGYCQKWRKWPKTCSDFGPWRWCGGGPPGLLSTMELENSSWPVNGSQINQTDRWRIKNKKKNDNVK